MNSIIAAIKKLFSLEGDPRTIAEALDAAELPDPGGLPEVSSADKDKGLRVNSSGAWEAADGVVFPETLTYASGLVELRAVSYSDMSSTRWKTCRFTALPITDASWKGKTIMGNRSTGAWNIVDFPEGVPAVTSADNGKILKVVDGAWAVASP